MRRLAAAGVPFAVGLATAACGDSVAPVANERISVSGSVIEDGQPAPDVSVQLGYRIFLGYEWGVERWETHALNSTLSASDGSYQVEGRVPPDACTRQVYVLAERGGRYKREIISCGSHAGVEIDLTCVPSLFITCPAPTGHRAEP